MESCRQCCIQINKLRNLIDRQTIFVRFIDLTCYEVYIHKLLNDGDSSKNILNTFLIHLVFKLIQTN